MQANLTMMPVKKTLMNPREQFSVKFTTNKEMYAPFEMEAVSDAFTSVELKKAAREVQK